MKRIFIGMSILVMVLAFAATRTMGEGQQQSEGMSGGQQGLSDSAIADEMLGKNVQNQQGQNFGQVLALASRNGEIAYILIAKNGDPGELTPIPFGATRFDSQKDAVILSVSDSELGQAPSIGIDELQLLDDPEFESEVRSYYGQEPASGQNEPEGEHEEPAPTGQLGEGMQQVGSKQQ